MSYAARLLLLIAFVSLTVLPSHAQSNGRSRAFELYQQGNDAEAAKMLEQLVKQPDGANDAELHNLLGLSMMNLDKVKSARNAFEKAVELQPGVSNYRSNLAFAQLAQGKSKSAKESAEKALQLDPQNGAAFTLLGQMELWDGELDAARVLVEKAIAADPKQAQGYLLKADVLLSELGKRVLEGSAIRHEVSLLKEAEESLGAAILRTGSGSAKQSIIEKRDGIKALHDHFDPGLNAARAPGDPPEPGTTPVRIIKKPQAVYSARAREAGVSGTVRLAVLLKADGTVGTIIKLWGPGYGLDEQSIAAARQIKFSPKMKNGVPVSTVVTIEYGFSIY